MDEIRPEDRELLDLAIAGEYVPFCFEDLSEKEIQELSRAEYDEVVVNKLMYF